MPSKGRFQALAEAGNSTGEVVASERAIVRLAGLDNAPLGAKVLFEDGQLGMIKSAEEGYMTVINLTSERVNVGTLAVMESDTFEIPAGPELLGRIIDPFGNALDGQGPITAKQSGEIFKVAPSISERTSLNQQIASGVMIVDSLFPILLGQRIALIGDHQTGKTTFLTQVINNQAGTGRVVVYVMIGKRRADLDHLIARLKSSGAMDYTILVNAGVFDSLGSIYMSPYAGAAIAESFWQKGVDSLVIYDDLTSHAKAYRELSLLAGSSPGRDSYPGDIFFQHSQLLERAGKLKSGTSITAFPVVVADNDDITGYLTTNIMSMSDGQLVFDQETFKQGIRPAVNAGLSVSRVGGRGQAEASQRLTQQLLKKLAQWRQAKEFSQFGSDLGIKAKEDLELGKKIYGAFSQKPDELYSLEEQLLILDTIMDSAGHKIDIVRLKNEAAKLSAGASGNHDQLKAQLLSLASVGEAK